SQSDRIGRQMREEFEKLHKFLRDEENSRIASLMEEEKKKGELIHRRKMRCEDITFLQRYYKDAKKICVHPLITVCLTSYTAISKLVLSMPNPPVPPVQSCSLSLRNNPSSLPRTAEASMARQRLTKAPPLPAPSGRVGPLPHATPPLPIATPHLFQLPCAGADQQPILHHQSNHTAGGDREFKEYSPNGPAGPAARGCRVDLPSLTWGPPTSHGGQTGIRLPVSAQRPRAEAGHGSGDSTLRLKNLVSASRKYESVSTRQDNLSSAPPLHFSATGNSLAGRGSALLLLSIWFIPPSISAKLSPLSRIPSFSFFYYVHCNDAWIFNENKVSF
ncbi:hypothetical protein JZ751_004570, partial [Albula glossodonta]